jgi:hypothetical protein
MIFICTIRSNKNIHISEPSQLVVQYVASPLELVGVSVIVFKFMLIFAVIAVQIVVMAPQAPQ